MINRNSRGSALYPILLEILEIDEDLITTAYFSNIADAYTLFSTLLPRDKSAIIYLMSCLNTNYDCSISDCGIE